MIGCRDGDVMNIIRTLIVLGILVAHVSFAEKSKAFVSDVYVDAECGLSVISYSVYELQQGILRFGYYLNDSSIKTCKTLREVFYHAVEGDTIAMGIPSNRVEYVFTFYDGDNQLHWLSKDSMSLSDDVNIVFGEVEYARYQNVKSTFTLAGASLFPPNKDGNKIFIDGRLYTQGYLENPEVVRLSSLRRSLPNPPSPPDSRDPRRFYIYLKDGTKAIAAKYPDAGNKFFSSGITWRQLKIDDESIVKLGIIDDGAFEQRLCLPKSDVDKISKDFFAEDDNDSFYDGFKQHFCGGFAKTKHPWIYTIIIGVLSLLVVLVWNTRIFPRLKGFLRKKGALVVDAIKRLMCRKGRKKGA